MDQKKIIEAIAEYASSNSSTNEENFYKLQNILSNDERGNKIPLPRSQIHEKKDIKLTQKVVDSDKIASMFSNELSELRNDPEFTGAVGQVDYLKEILAADSKVI